MTRDAFIARLRRGLSGLPSQTVDDFVADYSAHFADGAAAGRSETEVAQALGDPDRLARELKADAGLKRWETERNASAAAGAIFAVIGLGAIDLLILLPLIISAASVLFAFYIVSFVLLILGGCVMAAGPFLGFPGGVPAAILAGVGMMSLAVAQGAVLTLLTIGFVNLLVWYGRLHFRLLQPAMAQPS